MSFNDALLKVASVVHFLLFIVLKSVICSGFGRRKMHLAIASILAIISQW